jgi:hypothetical protein
MTGLFGLNATSIVHFAVPYSHREGEGESDPMESGDFTASILQTGSPQGD